MVRTRVAAVRGVFFDGLRFALSQSGVFCATI